MRAFSSHRLPDSTSWMFHWRTDLTGASVLQPSLCNIRGIGDTQQVCKVLPFFHHQPFLFAPQSICYTLTHCLLHWFTTLFSRKPKLKYGWGPLLCLDTEMHIAYRLAQVVRQALAVLGALAFHQLLAGRGIARGCRGLLWSLWVPFHLGSLSFHLKIQQQSNQQCETSAI